MLSHSMKFLVICLLFSLYEVLNHLSFMLEEQYLFQSLEYNLLLNLIGGCLAGLAMLFLGLYFEARKECVKLGLYTSTSRKKISIVGWHEMKKLWRNLRGISSGNVIGLAVSFFLVAILGPIAIGTIANTTTTNWDSAVVTVFQVVCPIIWVVGVAIRYLPGRE